MVRMIGALLVAAFAVSHVTSLNMALPTGKFAMFNNLGCSTCEGVLDSVKKTIPDVNGVSETALRLAIKGSCAAYTLGFPLAIPACNYISDKATDILVDDVIGGAKNLNAKSSCRKIGLCPPCGGASKKVVLASKPNHPLPWEKHDTHSHRMKIDKARAELERRRKVLHQQFVRNLTLSPAHHKSMLDSVSCYSCKSVLGMVGHDITNVKTAGRNLLINTIKSQCKSWLSVVPLNDRLCTTMAEKMVESLADDILNKAEVRPGENCRTIKMCPPCNGKCPDEEEIDKSKEEAKKGETPLPNKDDGCSEPPPNEGAVCTDNQAKCASGSGGCNDSYYKQMMRYECMYTCVCKYLPAFLQGWGK